VNRVLSLQEALVWRREEAEAGRKVVFTNGCFDLLHRGHADLLAKARALGDALVVGLNSDASVARLKGASRPLVSGEDRASLLAALRAVDVVVVFEEDTPLSLITALLPDVLVKGADYAKEDVVGGEVVTASGGRVELIPLTRGRSTTSLLDRLQGD